MSINKIFYELILKITSLNSQNMHFFLIENHPTFAQKLIYFMSCSALIVSSLKFLKEGIYNRLRIMKK